MNLVDEVFRDACDTAEEAIFDTMDEVLAELKG